MKAGKNTFIHPTAVIYDNVQIGDNCYIGEYCVIGSFAEHPHIETKANGLVVIGNNVKLTKLVTIDSPLDETGKTTINDNCYLMASSHVGHDCFLFENVTLSCGAKIGGHSLIGTHTTIGLNATIHQKSFIPDGSMIGANAFYKGESIWSFKVWVGVPAKIIGDNWRLKEKLNK